MYGDLAASTRVRFLQYFDSLRKGGVCLDANVLLPNEYLKWKFAKGSFPIKIIISNIFIRFKVLMQLYKYDFAILYSELFPLVPAWLETKLLNIPYIYDMDDAFYEKYKKSKLQYLQKKIKTLVQASSYVFAGNKILQRNLSKFNSNTLHVPSVAQKKNYTTKKTYIRSRKLVICWIGSPTTSKYLKNIIKPIIKAGKKISIQLIIIGGNMPNLPFIEKLELPWTEHIEKYILAKSDLGIMPLVAGEWENGKCGYKIIQYGTVGLPVMASKVGANVDICGKNSLSLCISEHDWYSRFKKIYNNYSFRKILALQLKARIADKYNFSQNVSKIRSVIYKILNDD